MKHIPVLKNEIVECFSYLKNISDGFFVDGTVGSGGHSLAIAERNKRQETITKFIGIDKDIKALDIAGNNINAAGLYDNFILVHDDFKNIKEILASLHHSGLDPESSIVTNKSTSWIPDAPTPSNSPSGRGRTAQLAVRDDILINGALLDLGVSSMQLDQKDRGFSFTDLNAKLDMRMDQSQKLDAILVLNHYPEEKLEKILHEYGEEKFSRGIAKNICLARRNKHIETVGDLIYILEKSIPIKIQKTSRSHFATKTFQAIRIEVNGELENLEKSLIDFVGFLRPGARLAVITFHSLEDRIVKNTFRFLASDCVCPDNAPICNCDKIAEVKLVNRKPIVASDEEIAENPRSRSAKLRIVEKLH